MSKTAMAGARDSLWRHGVLLPGKVGVPWISGTPAPPGFKTPVDIICKIDTGSPATVIPEWILIEILRAPQISTVEAQSGLGVRVKRLVYLASLWIGEELIASASCVIGSKAENSNEASRGHICVVGRDLLCKARLTYRGEEGTAEAAFRETKEPDPIDDLPWWIPAMQAR